MGMRNRERRAAKQRAREQRRRERVAREEQTGPGRPGGPDLADLVQAVVVDTVNALFAGAGARAEEHIEWLASAPGDGAGGDRARGLVDTIVFQCLQAAVKACAWQQGWQPQDLARVVERNHSARHARLAVDTMSAELRGYAAATVDERWDAQLRALDAQVWWDNDGEYLSRWGERERLDRVATVRHALHLLALVDGLPELPRLSPPPGEARRGSLAGRAASGAGVDQRMLARVRALLAKAESTEFPEEADALTAKAQELMARHSIDYALLAAAQGGQQEPVGIRVGIDNPYEAAKSSLLSEVASANRCRAVWLTQFGFSTVLGYPADLESVEMLYTSLLVQATAAMMREGTRKDRSGRSRTRSFRQSFLNAYAVRIGQRLRGATEDASRAAVREMGDDRLLPVLAARDDAVEEATAAMFPRMVHRRVAINNMEGWASGTAAADLAALHGRGEVADAAAR